jgi:hypothetical protein
LIFYATVVTVYSLMFLVLAIQVPSGSSSPFKALISIAGNAPTMLSGWEMFWAVALTCVYLIAGLVIPLAVLAGFLTDAIWWRAIAFGATVLLIAGAVFYCVLAAVTALEDFSASWDQASLRATNNPDAKAN